jgi:hypothetical protein
MSDHSSWNLDFALSMLQVTTRRFQKVERLLRDLVSEFFSVVDVVSADTDDVTAGL